MTTDEAINSLEHMIKWGDTYEVDEDACKLAIKALKKQAIKGHWIIREHGVKCSKCLIVFPHSSIYCPNCGTDMRGEDKE